MLSRASLRQCGVAASSWRPALRPARAACRWLSATGRVRPMWGSAPSSLLAHATNPVHVLMGANVAVFCAFTALGSDARVSRFFSRHMVLRPSNLRRGDYASLLGSVFTHLQPLHLLFNMLALQSFGGAALAMLGSGAFLGLYAAAGLAGSLAQVNYPRAAVALRAPARFSLPPDAAAVGASGAIAGLIAYVCVRVPSGTTTVLVLPVPNRIFLPLAASISAYLAWTSGDSSVGHASHLGGAVIGAVFALTRRRGGAGW